MIEQAEHLMEGVSWSAVVLGAIFAYYAYRHGIPWVWAKMQSIWASIKGGSVRLENLIATSVEDVHQRVDDLVVRVEALESKPAVVVNVPPAPAPVVHVTAPAPVNPAPVSPVTSAPMTLAQKFPGLPTVSQTAQAHATPVTTAAVTTGGPNG